VASAIELLAAPKRVQRAYWRARNLEARHQRPPEKTITFAAWIKVLRLMAHMEARSPMGNIKL
jgi:hypothetical protein